MNEYIAYCGLDCEACEARLATVNNDNELRQRVAREWSELNGVEITAEMINCSGLIEECWPSAKKETRFSIRKDTQFDIPVLKKMADTIPEGYELRRIDAEIYDQCLLDPFTCDFVSCFESKEQYLELGRGMVLLKNGRIVTGASSYTRYNEGIEIEVDTVEEERRKGLATAASAALILRCLDEGLYPSWDAQNMLSVHLAEKLGYEFDHEYTVYEVASDERTH